MNTPVGFHIAVIDFEATCNNNGQPPVREEREIIEIGGAILNWKDEVISQFQTFIKPIRHPQLTTFCIELTSIQQSDVDSAIGFVEASKRLHNWLNTFEHCAIAGWGGFEYTQMKRECDFNGVTNPFANRPYINLKYAFGRTNKIKPKSLAKALRTANKDTTGNPHRAINDAINAAKLITHIDVKPNFHTAIT